jgi:tripartite-type tricarboxylate transporter receptor subunit TctC
MQMRSRFGRIVWVIIFILQCGTTTVVVAQDYPTRPIHVIVATSPGGVSDIFVRALGEELHKSLGQPLVIENRPGGAFNVAAKACAGSRPDGYTLCVLSAEPLTYNQFLFKEIGFDPDTSFAPITNLFFITQVLAVSSSLNVKNLPELAALSKAKKGTLSYSAPGVAQALFVENFKKETGADMVRVPFKGGADAIVGLLNGTTPVVFLGLGNLISQIQAGKAIPLVVDSDTRSALIANVPTLKEIAYRGDITRSYFSIVAPAATPQSIILKLHGAITRIIREPAFRDRNLTQRGLEPAINSTPAEFSAFIKTDREAAKRVVKASGLEPQ